MQPNLTGRSSFYSTASIRCGSHPRVTNHIEKVIDPTIMGIFGNREATFKADLQKQMQDIQRLSAQHCSLCVIGDFNLSFHDNYYFTRDGRNMVVHTFQDCGIDLLTGCIPECIDHIAITNGFIDRVTTIHEWNVDRTLSDHKGIVIEVAPKAKS